jgi:bacteriocin-like protein
MQFEKIAGFKKMTEEAMKNTIGGGGPVRDTMQQKTFKTRYGKTNTTCGTNNVPNSDACVLQDVQGVDVD